MATTRLREIRREGPGRLRGGALEILVDLGGADALDETDRLAVERPVRVKILDERPVETPMEGGRWLAFPADRLDDAVTALGLSKATHGHGWLATTHPDVPNTRFKGALSF
ncbi:hypothetical protein [Streptomyces sp. NPDC058954]|uniref:hypothetical protein n=1 Tax=Streptomyces sp. NPDC058954 TaxID=3346677 RepID=UPI0036990640